jgi:diacylglycerol kinase family enzyme
VADQIAGSVGVVKSNDAVESQLSQARRLYLEALQRQPVRRSSIKLDGETIAGDYLLIEVLNIAAIGPGVRLTGDVSPADGLLSVVASGIAERPSIKDYMRERVNGEPDHAGLPSWRASRVELNGLDEYHIDDEARSAKGKTVSIGIKPGFLPVLG